MKKFKHPLGYEEITPLGYLLAVIYLVLIGLLIFGFVFGAIWLAANI